MDWLRDQIKEALDKGKRPAITLYPGTEVIMPKRKRGRPRKYPEGVPRFYRYPGLHGRSRPRCLAKRCANMLKRDQRGACSPACADAIFNHALFLLRQIDTTEEELLQYFKKQPLRNSHANDPAA